MGSYSLVTVFALKSNTTLRICHLTCVSFVKNVAKDIEFRHLHLSFMRISEENQESFRLTCATQIIRLMSFILTEVLVCHPRT